MFNLIIEQKSGSAAQFAKCILLPAYSRITLAPISFARSNKNFI